MCARNFVWLNAQVNPFKRLLVAKHNVEFLNDSHLLEVAAFMYFCINYYYYFYSTRSDIRHLCILKY
jgi:hypothetical protein